MIWFLKRFKKVGSESKDLMIFFRWSSMIHFTSIFNPTSSSLNNKNITFPSIWIYYVFDIYGYYIFDHILCVGCKIYCTAVMYVFSTDLNRHNHYTQQLQTTSQATISQLGVETVWESKIYFLPPREFYDMVSCSWYYN